MKQTALLYFDGTNVMLIRESDVPTLEGLKQQMCGVGPEGWCDRDGCCKGYCVAANCSIGSMADRAKKKAIMVEGGFSKRMVPLVGVKIVEITIFNEVTFCLGEGKTTDLPEGYTYEVEQHCIKCGLPDYEVNSCKAQEDCEEDQESVAVIKPVVVLLEEGEDENEKFAKDFAAFCLRLNHKQADKLNEYMDAFKKNPNLTITDLIKGTN